MVNSFFLISIILPALIKGDGEIESQSDTLTGLFDFSCVIATVTGGGTSDGCRQTEDQDSKACVWCDATPDQGICLSADQAEIAEAFGIQCSDSTDDEDKSEAVEGLLDYTCLLTTVTGGTKDACTSTNDQDSDACVWCDASDDQGICLTKEQAEIAEQFGLPCGNDNEIKEDEVEVQSEALTGLSDFSCLIATVTGGGTSDGCIQTEDQDTNSCVWCDATPDQGICLTKEQSEIAEVFGIQCSDSTNDEDKNEAVEGLLDYTCLLATVTGGTKDACTATKDQDSDACVWCDASDDQGICLTKEQAEIAEQLGLSCSDVIENNTIDVAYA